MAVFLFAWLLSSVTPVPPSPQPGSAAAAAPAVVFGYPPSYFEELWQQRQELLKQGDVTHAKQTLETLLAAKKLSGWPDFPVYGEALAIESERARLATDLTQATLLATQSIALAPHRVAPYMAMAAVLWAKNDKIDACRALGNAVSVLLLEPPLWRAYAGYLGIMAVIALIGAGLAFAMVMMSRYGALVVHHAQHVFFRRLTHWQTWVVLGLLLLLPVLLRTGPVVTTFVWLLVCLPFLRFSERLVACIWSLLMVLVVFLLPLLCYPWLYPGSRAEQVYEILRDVQAQDASHRLSQQTDLTPLELYALGLRARWSGQQLLANQAFERATALNPKVAEFYISLGNLYYFASDMSGAIAAYQKALEIDANHVVALFNLSQVYLNQADTQSDLTRQKAHDLNFHVVNQISDWCMQTGIKVAEPEIPRALLELNAPWDPDSLDSLVEALWRRLQGGILPHLFVVPGALLLCLWVFVLSRWRYAFAKSCNRCGSSSCQTCEPKLHQTELCYSCQQVFNDSVDMPQLRIKKEIESYRFAAKTLLTRRICIVTLVGVGQILRGFPGRGMILITLFALGQALITHLAWMPVLQIDNGTTWGLMSTGCSLWLMLVYIVSVIDGQREE